VLLIGTFEASHIVGPTGALALVLGANLGGALPALINASTRIARRLPLGNLLVRATGVVLALAVSAGDCGNPDSTRSGLYAPRGQFSSAVQCCAGRSLFSLRWASWRASSRAGCRTRPRRPTRAAPCTSMRRRSIPATVALANASRETLRMADMIDVMLRDTRELIAGESLQRADAVAATGRSVDQLGESIRRYLADLGDDQTLHLRSEGARAQDILSAVINLEHVADISPTASWNSPCAASGAARGSHPRKPLS